MDEDIKSVKDDILADAIATAIENEKEIAKLTKINYFLTFVIFVLLIICM